MSGPGWYPDPTGRFEHRYHNGSAWTADVSVDGHRRVDLQGARPSSPGGPPPPPVPAPATGRNGLAVASMVIGIVVVAGGWLPFIAYLGVPAAITAFVLGINGRRRSATTGVGGGMATAGLILAPIGLVLAIFGIWLTHWMIDAIERYEHPARHEASVGECVVSDGRLLVGGELTNTSERAASFTLRLALSWDVRNRERLVEVDDVAPGSTVEWSDRVSVGDTAMTATCEIERVHGPLPLGVDPD